MLEITQTPLSDCFVLKPPVFKDDRGVFSETFKKEQFEKETGLSAEFVQDNQSSSSRGVLRGLHFQTGSMAQAKLVRVIVGEVMDVVIDLRKNSSTFGQQFSVILSESNHLQLYVPRGFAHGFITLSERSVFSYKCDNYYHKESESGIIYNDATLNIDWRLDDSELLVSAKDLQLPTFREVTQ